MDRWMSPRRALALLIGVCVSVRIAMFIVYQPVVYPDTATYEQLASQLRSLDFTGYEGIRTPGYAVLLLLAGQDHMAAWIIQCLLGIAISILLFRITLLYTGSPAWALAAGLGHTLALNQIFFEPNILSETLTTFLVVLSVVLLSEALQSRRSSTAMAAGASSSFAALVRPAYLHLGPLVALLVLCFERDGKRMGASIMIVFLVPVMAWAMFNKATLGYLGLSTNAGYGLTNHSGRFMEYAPDEYKVIRDIYLKHRQEKIAETGNSAVTIFLARDEMRRQTGLDHIALSQRLTRLSLELFVAHPALYLKSVGEAWASFWAVPIYVRWDSFTVPAAARLVESAFRVQRALLLCLNVFALVASGYVIAATVIQRFKGVHGLSIPMIVSCMLLSTSVLQALAEYGENPRYAIPTQSLAVMLVLLAVWDLRRFHKRRRFAVAHVPPAVAGP